MIGRIVVVIAFVVINWLGAKGTMKKLSNLWQNAKGLTLAMAALAAIAVFYVFVIVPIRAWRKIVGTPWIPGGPP